MASSNETETIISRNLDRLNPDRIRRQPKFCLSQVFGLESMDPDVLEKRDDLLNRAEGDIEGDAFVVQCSIGGCERVLKQSIKGGQRQTMFGSCKAATYCLNQAFADTSKDAYRDVISTCQSIGDSNNSGSSCPRLDCSLSAGFSIDGHRGTVGICIRDENSNQFELPFPDVSE